MDNKRIARELIAAARDLVSADTFKCPDCGTKVLEQTGFCVKCKKKVKKAREMTGTAAENKKAASSMKNVFRILNEFPRIISKSENKWTDTDKGVEILKRAAQQLNVVAGNIKAKPADDDFKARRENEAIVEFIARAIKAGK